MPPARHRHWSPARAGQISPRDYHDSARGTPRPEPRRRLSSLRDARGRSSRRRFFQAPDPAVGRLAPSDSAQPADFAGRSFAGFVLRALVRLTEARPDGTTVPRRWLGAARPRADIVASWSAPGEPDRHLLDRPPARPGAANPGRPLTAVRTRPATDSERQSPGLPPAAP